MSHPHTLLIPYVVKANQPSKLRMITLSALYPVQDPAMLPQSGPKCSPVNIKIY